MGRCIDYEFTSLCSLMKEGAVDWMSGVEPPWRFCMVLHNAGVRCQGVTPSKLPASEPDVHRIKVESGGAAAAADAWWDDETPAAFSPLLQDVNGAADGDTRDTAMVGAGSGTANSGSGGGSGGGGNGGGGGGGDGGVGANYWCSAAPMSAQEEETRPGLAVARQQAATAAPPPVQEEREAAAYGACMRPAVAAQQAAAAASAAQQEGRGAAADGALALLEAAPQQAAPAAPAAAQSEHEATVEEASEHKADAVPARDGGEWRRALKRQRQTLERSSALDALRGASPPPPVSRKGSAQAPPRGREDKQEAVSAAAAAGAATATAAAAAVDASAAAATAALASPERSGSGAAADAPADALALSAAAVAASAAPQAAAAAQAAEAVNARPFACWPREETKRCARRARRTELCALRSQQQLERNQAVREASEILAAVLGLPRAAAAAAPTAKATEGGGAQGAPAGEDGAAQLRAEGAAAAHAAALPEATDNPSTQAAAAAAAADGIPTAQQAAHAETNASATGAPPERRTSKTARPRHTSKAIKAQRLAEADGSAAAADESAETGAAAAPADASPVAAGTRAPAAAAALDERVGAMVPAALDGAAQLPAEGAAAAHAAALPEATDNLSAQAAAAAAVADGIGTAQQAAHAETNASATGAPVERKKSKTARPRHTSKAIKAQRLAAAAAAAAASAALPPAAEADGSAAAADESAETGAAAAPADASPVAAGTRAPAAAAALDERVGAMVPAALDGAAQLPAEGAAAANAAALPEATDNLSAQAAAAAAVADGIGTAQQAVARRFSRERNGSAGGAQKRLAERAAAAAAAAASAAPPPAAEADGSAAAADESAETSMAAAPADASPGTAGSPAPAAAAAALDERVGAMVPAALVEAAAPPGLATALAAVRAAESPSLALTAPPLSTAEHQAATAVSTILTGSETQAAGAALQQAAAAPAPAKAVRRRRKSKRKASAEASQGAVDGEWAAGAAAPAPFEGGVLGAKEAALDVAALTTYAGGAGGTAGAREADGAAEAAAFSEESMAWNDALVEYLNTRGSIVELAKIFDDSDDNDRFGARTAEASGAPAVVAIEKEGLRVDELQLGSTSADAAAVEEELGKRMEALLSVSAPAHGGAAGGGPLRHLWQPAVRTYSVESTKLGLDPKTGLVVAGGGTTHNGERKMPCNEPRRAVLMAIVLGVLLRYFPDDGFIAEESSAVLSEDPATLAAVVDTVRRAISPDCTAEDVCAWIDLGARGGKGGASDRTWVLDPIDGTKGKLNCTRYPLACVLILQYSGTGSCGRDLPLPAARQRRAAFGYVADSAHPQPAALTTAVTTHMAATRHRQPQLQQPPPRVSGNAFGRSAQPQPALSGAGGHNHSGNKFWGCGMQPQQLNPAAAATAAATRLAAAEPSEKMCFIRQEQFCCALGMLEGGKAVLGVLGCPVLPADLDKPEDSQRGQLLFAARGGGAFRRSMGAPGGDAAPIRTSGAARARDGVVLESAEAAHSSHGVAAEVCADLQISRPPIRMDSQCKYGCLAAGQGSIYLRMPRRCPRARHHVAAYEDSSAPLSSTVSHPRARAAPTTDTCHHALSTLRATRRWGYRENIWDHVGGAVVIEEAGGRVSDSMGGELDFSQGAKLPPHVAGIVATSGPIHDEVIAAVRRRLGRDFVAALKAAPDAATWKGLGPGAGDVTEAARGDGTPDAMRVTLVCECAAAQREGAQAALARAAASAVAPHGYPWAGVQGAKRRTGGDGPGGQFSKRIAE
ncbi:hypothetical protein JKP88DRAFT_268082 [Tribonema minus]|uniref:Uncharacterized protein n=1 Tax=Tribonema minus TaxID=303371 RepID=A0A836CIL6_9STRA|nr:hypothetical protein JKP88DRAFT_268082 [Tribonema minus]